MIYKFSPLQTSILKPAAVVIRDEPSTSGEDWTKRVTFEKGCSTEKQIKEVVSVIFVCQYQKISKCTLRI